VLFIVWILLFLLFGKYWTFFIYHKSVNILDIFNTLSTAFNQYFVLIFAQLENNAMLIQHSGMSTTSSNQHSFLQSFYVHHSYILELQFIFVTAISLISRTTNNHLLFWFFFSNNNKQPNDQSLHLHCLFCSVWHQQKTSA